MPGWSEERYRQVFRDISGNLNVTAATSDTSLQAAITNHTIFIQRIVFYVTTSAAQSMSFEDDAETPIQIANIPATPADDTRWEFYFGPKGVPLTQGQAFKMNVSAAGLAGQLTWDGYAKLTGVAGP